MPSDAHQDSGDFDRLFAERERTDTANPDQAATSDDQGRTVPSDIEATFMYQESSSLKKERDVAFALAAIEASLLTERQLSGAVKDWTIHGGEPLSQHLIDAQLITASAAEDLGRKANENREIAAARASRAEGSRSDIMATLLELDPTGRILHTLGVGVTATLESSDHDRQVITDYRLLRKLGQGGMGTVWLARDEKLGRLVAIKEIRQQARDDDTALRRFRREAQVTGRLEHPSIVPVHQLGEHVESGKAFYVMRFIGKRTLEDAITEYHERRDAGDVNPMHLHHLLTSFVTVCQAIAYAHSRNVVHRDLKPENIALDDYGQVIVLDWGLAKLTGRGELQELFGDIELKDMAPSNESTAGQVLGTPMYMSPEQAAGRIDEIEATTDVYGLGAVLFSILTGYAPHEMSHQSLTGSSKVSELFQVIVSGQAPDASKINPDAPAELVAICSKAMANKRYARYGDALELAEDVQRWMAGEPVSTYAEPLRTRVRRWVGRHRHLTGLASVFLTIVVVTAVTLAITSQQNRLAQEVNHFENLRADGRELEVRLRAVADELQKDTRFMAALPPIQGIAGARSSADTDPEEVWRTRLETIYGGLLDSNPNYLSASFSSVSAAPSAGEPAAKKSENKVHEIVHVERNESGGLVRVMPRSRLLARERTGILSTMLELKPGDVAVNASRLHQDTTATASQGLVLAAGTPVYSDSSGKLFGIVTLETDLRQTIRDLLVSTVESGENAYIVDAQGQILMHYSRDSDFQEDSVGRDITQFVTSAGPFFSDEHGTTFSDGRETYGLKVRIDPRHSTEYLGIVLTVEH